MLSLGSPSHYMYYGALYRRKLWLEALSNLFLDEGKKEAQLLIRDIQSDHHQTLSRLAHQSHLGIQHQLSLEKVIDDTPLDSFLYNLTDHLNEYEKSLFQLFTKYFGEAHAFQQWISKAHHHSKLWGREIAQECLLTKNLGLFSEKTIGNLETLKGLLELLRLVFQGGEFIWKPFLVRRYTAHALEYECRNCPHFRFQDEKPGKNLLTETRTLACRLEASLFEGFLHALYDKIDYNRKMSSNMNDQAGLPAWCTDSILAE